MIAIDDRSEAAPADGSIVETSTSIIEFVDDQIDNIIEKVALKPSVVVHEFSTAGVTRADGGPVTSVEDLGELRLGDSQTMANRYIKLYAKTATAQGFVTGLGGLITLPATIPTDIAAYVAWLARAGSAIQLCYGFEYRTELGDKQLKLAMLAGAGVTSVTVRGSEVLVTELAKQVMRTPYAHAPIQSAVKALAAKIGVTLGHKHFAKAVPVVGGVINGSVQGGLVYAGGKNIHRHYRELLSAPPV